MSISGFSDDGYIIDQDMFSAYPYRTMPSNINGCGWIAAYNMRRALGQDVYFDDVRRELDEMFALRVPGPTTMSAMRRYMTKYVPGHHYSSGTIPSSSQPKAARPAYSAIWNPACRISPRMSAGPMEPTVFLTWPTALRTAPLPCVILFAHAA
jgi:hypothetical protein